MPIGRPPANQRETIRVLRSMRFDHVYDGYIKTISAKSGKDFTTVVHALISAGFKDLEKDLRGTINPQGTLNAKTLLGLIL